MARYLAQWGLMACALAWGLLEFLALQRSRCLTRLGGKMRR